MKILELHYSTAAAGAERLVIDLSNELSRNNELVLCTTDDDSILENSYYKNEISSRIKYINLKCKSGLGIKSIWRILKIIKEEKPDIVHSHANLITLFLPAILLPGIRYFHTIHNLAERCLINKNLKFIYKWFYKKKVQPVTISQLCLDSYKKLYNMDNAINIVNGRSRLQRTTDYDKVTIELNELKIHDDDKIFVHVARCAKAKNQKLLVDTFNRFLNEGYHGVLILIGTAYDSEENIHILNNAQKGIYWLGAKNNVGDYLLQADFFVLSSLFEGLPISLLEAISCGVIPICTPAGGIPDVINSESNGYVSKSFGADDFYYTLKRAFDDEKYFNRIHLEEYFENNFSMRHCAEGYFNAFSHNDTE